MRKGMGKRFLILSKNYLYSIILYLDFRANINFATIFIA